MAGPPPYRGFLIDADNTIFDYDQAERETIAAALRAAGGNVAAAARALGVDRANLHRRLQRLGLKA